MRIDALFGDRKKTIEKTEIDKFQLITQLRRSLKEKIQLPSQAFKVSRVRKLELRAVQS